MCVHTNKPINTHAHKRAHQVLVAEARSERQARLLHSSVSHGDASSLERSNAFNSKSHEAVPKGRLSAAEVNVCVCIYICIFTWMFVVCVYVYMYMCIHTYVLCIYTCIFVVCIYVYVYTYVCTEHIYTFVYMCVLYINIYIYV